MKTCRTGFKIAWTVAFLLAAIIHTIQINLP